MGGGCQAQQLLTPGDSWVVDGLHVDAMLGEQEITDPAVQHCITHLDPGEKSVSAPLAPLLLALLSRWRESDQGTPLNLGAYIFKRVLVSGRSRISYQGVAQWQQSDLRYMHPNVHNSTTYNSQDMETIQVPINT